MAQSPCIGFNMGRASIPHPCAIFTLLRNSCVFANSLNYPFFKGSFRTTSTNPSNSRDVIVKLCSSGSLKEACERFRPDIWSDPSLFSNLLQGCIPNKSLCEARQLHSLIITSGASSDRFISNHLLNIYAKFGELETATSMFETMPRKNVMSYNILVGGFIQNGDLKTAHRIFNEMPDRNVASWNAMLAGLIDFGFNEEGLQLFLGMRKCGLQPDEFTLGSVLRGCAGIKGIVSGRQIHVSVIKSGLQCDLCVGSSLAHMYMNCRCVDEGERVLEGMPVRNVVSFNTIIAGRAQNGFPEIALNHFHEMKVAGLAPDQVTFVSVIASCSELATLGQGQQVHAQTIKAGVNSEVAVQSSLVSMYSKCGCLNDSVTIFLESDSLDLVLWSSTIAAYGFHGQGQEAIILFKRMVEEGIEPNDVTFLSLLYACTHSGLKKQGMEFFEIMTRKYRIEPRLEHYTCMVDLLGRSGCLEEAEKMINSMPVRPDAVIWKTMLSACKIHRKVEMAERVAGHVVRLDPQDSAPYVLLSNIRATDERWEDVSEVRASMRERKVRKEPGISWVELKNHVHQFCIGDRSHPKQTEIDQYLNELVTEMKQHGYVPDTSTVLHDMEDEEKEYSLVHHSEKMAIAFAILNTPEGTLIRVMKNLRVCDDCHIAIMFISKIKMREIVVRDASRFHHFRDGECSCGGYW